LIGQQILCQVSRIPSAQVQRALRGPWHHWPVLHGSPATLGHGLNRTIV